MASHDEMSIGACVWAARLPPGGSAVVARSQPLHETRERRSSGRGGCCEPLQGDGGHGRHYRSMRSRQRDRHAPEELHERGSGRSGCLSTGSAPLSRSTAPPRASASVQYIYQSLLSVPYVSMSRIRVCHQFGLQFSHSPPAYFALLSPRSCLLYFRYFRSLLFLSCRSGGEPTWGDTDPEPARHP